MEIKTNIPIPQPHIHSQFSVVASKMNAGDCVDVEKSQECLCAKPFADKVIFLNAKAG